MNKLTAIYVPSLNVAYIVKDAPPPLESKTNFVVDEIIDRSREFDDHTEYYFEVRGIQFTRVLIDVPVVLFYRDDPRLESGPM